MSEQNIIEKISEQNRTAIPKDIRKARGIEWYVEETINNPKIARDSHQRVSDMFDYYGCHYEEDTGIVEYFLASKDPLHDGEYAFYGEDVLTAVHNFVNKLKSGARKLGPERRIKLLLGPVGSGKSAFDALMRKYYEDYTRTDEGAMYTFRWVDLCDKIEDQDVLDDAVVSPLSQDPLVLIPLNERKEIVDQINENLDAPYTIRNRQRLDPESELYMDRLMAYYDDDLSKVLTNHIEVIRLVADENKRQCIETFEPKDKKNQDETELTGTVDLSMMGLYPESDPRAFDFSGAFCNANRGIFRGEELLKLQREFLYDFLHAAQERTIKPKNKSRIDIDQVIVGRTNMPEYRDKKGDEKMEAFNDRTKRIDFPYILGYDEEAKIYEKLLRNADVGDVHIEPHTLEMAGLFGVLTRVSEPGTEEISVVQKAQAYNGEERDDDIDIKKLRKEGEDDADIVEGMEGISPRFIGDEIAEAIMDSKHRERSFLTPLTLFKYIEEHLEGHGSIEEGKLPRYEEYLSLVRGEYKERAVQDVRTALAYDIDEIQRQGEKYMDHVMAYIDDRTLEDEFTGRDVEPDEKFLRDVEQHLNIPEDRKNDFRQEVSHWVSRRARQGSPFKPRDNPKLRRALERKLWEDKKHNINFSSLVTSGKIDEEEKGVWVESLGDLGYSKGGAEEILDFVGAEVAKEEME